MNVYFYVAVAVDFGFISPKFVRISCFNPDRGYCLSDFQGDEFFTMDDFGHHSDQRGPLQPPVRKALAVFSGRRNPNDNHYSRSKPK